MEEENTPTALLATTVDNTTVIITVLDIQYKYELENQTKETQTPTMFVPVSQFMYMWEIGAISNIKKLHHPK